MWQLITPPLTPSVAAVTTSVWEYPTLIQVGVMRTNFLRPPILWAQVLAAGARNLRRGPKLLTELQRIINAPVVFAEVELDKPRNQALLLFLGFTELPENYNRKLYTRSI
jgi:hypothetical protein